MLIEEAKQAIADTGLSVVADRLGYTSQRVSNWYTRGVPDNEVLGFCRAVDWRVTPHQMCSKNYPHKHDGLPEHLRVAA